MVVLVADSPSPPSCSSPRPSSVFRSRSSRDITGVSDLLSLRFSDFSMVSRTDHRELLSLADHAQCPNHALLACFWGAALKKVPEGAWFPLALGSLL